MHFVYEYSVFISFENTGNYDTSLSVGTFNVKNLLMWNKYAKYTIGHNRNNQQAKHLYQPYFVSKSIFSMKL